MKRFSGGQRVFVVSATGHIVNAPGTVRRLCRSDGSAWVALDARHADARMHPFPADDHRATWVLTWPQDCKAEKKTKAVANG